MARQRHQVLIIIIGILVIGAMMVGTGLRSFLRRMRARDLEGAPIKTSIAKVEALYGANPNDVETRKPWAMVRFEGKLYPAAAARNVQQLKPGDPAQIRFRIGHSGKIYVDDVEPLPPPVER